MKVPGKRFCRGQAITEMMACLIGICFVVLGILFISVVGSKGVRNILEARKDAESHMANGTGSASGQSISTWQNIEPGHGDGLYFTADDKPSSGNTGNSSLYSRELVSSDGSFHIPSLAGNRKSENYEPFSIVESSQLFVRAADLKEGKASLTDPLNEEHLHDLRRAMGRLGMVREVTIDDKLYLPEIPD